MIQELNRVVLTVDLPDYQLEAGDLGTVVLVDDENAGYMVEFVTLDGDTLAVVTLLPEQVRPIQSREIAHARAVAL